MRETILWESLNSDIFKAFDANTYIMHKGTVHEYFNIACKMALYKGCIAYLSVCLGSRLHTVVYDVDYAELDLCIPSLSNLLLKHTLK